MSIFLRTAPHHLQEKVMIDTEIQVQLMTDFNALTVTEKTVALFNMDSQKSEPIVLRYKSKILNITPKSKLQPNTHYQVELIGGSEGIQDIYGNLLAQTYSFEFRTAESKQIKTPVMLTPADLSQVGSNVSFSWSPVENAYFYEIQVSKSNTFDVVDWPGEGHRISETSVVPDIVYQPITYFARVRAANSEGLRSAYSKVIRFAVQRPITPDAASSDSKEAQEIDALQAKLLESALILGEELEVSVANPKNNSVHIDLGFKPVISITFNELLDPSSVTIDSIYLVEEKN